MAIVFLKLKSEETKALLNSARIKMLSRDMNISRISNEEIVLEALRNFTNE